MEVSDKGAPSSFELLAPARFIPRGSLRHVREFEHFSDSFRAGFLGTVREFEHFSDMGTYALICVGLQECMRRVEGSWSLASSACGAKEVIELHIIHRIANVWWHIMEDLN